jgi:hypothetical protein
MPATHVSSSERTAQAFGAPSGGSWTVDIASATTGQTRYLAVNSRPVAASPPNAAPSITQPSGWTTIYNEAHANADNTGRLAVFSRVVSGTEGAGTVSVACSGSIAETVLATWVADGTGQSLGSGGAVQQTSWSSTYTTPSVAISGGADLAYRIAATSRYPRTVGWAAATEIVDVATSGGPTLSVAHQAVSGSTTGTEVATLTGGDDPGYVLTLTAAPIAGGTTADIVGSADTVAVSSVTLTGGPVLVAVGADYDLALEILGGPTGSVPIVNAVAALPLTLPTGAADVTQLAPTDAVGRATVRVTGTGTAVGESPGSLVATFAGAQSASVTVSVLPGGTALAVRVDGISSTMAGGGSTPLAGWYAWVHEPAPSAAYIVGDYIFAATGIALGSDSAGGLRAQFTVPSGNSLVASDSVRVILRRADTVSASVSTEECGVLIGAVVSV